MISPSEDTKKTEALLNQGLDGDADVILHLDTQNTGVQEVSQQGTAQDYGEVA